LTVEYDQGGGKGDRKRGEVSSKKKEPENTNREHSETGWGGVGRFIVPIDTTRGKERERGIGGPGGGPGKKVFVFVGGSIETKWG